MENIQKYMHEYESIRKDLIERYDRLGHNLMKWLVRNSIPYDKDESFSTRIVLGEYLNTNIVIRLEPEKSRIVVEAPLDGVASTRNIKHQSFILRFNGHPILKRILDYLKRSYDVPAIYIITYARKEVELYKSKTKICVKKARRLTYLLNKIEQENQEYRQQLIIAEF